MKNIGKRIVVLISWFIIGRLIRENDFKIVAVTGSVGKTSTKRAIATVLSKKYKVQWQDGNYNDIVSVPLVFFGLEMPSLTNPGAWVRTFKIMWQKKTNYPYEVVILELGTDAPGQIDRFKKYIRADIAVVTPIAPEHMEYFGSLDAVAKEELSVQSYASKLIVYENTAGSYKELVKKEVQIYGNSEKSDSFIAYNADHTKIKTKNNEYNFRSRLLGEHQVANLAAACLVSEELGMSKNQIETGLADVEPGAGRMSRLKGIKSSIIIDDTYNSSPSAARAALDTLKRLPGTQKIAVLGNMNEMGGMSKHLHEELGNYCDPNSLDSVITIGVDANKYLAPAAQAKGCTVRTAESPQEVAKILKDIMEDQATILLKGSQNGVFLEEAVKQILADPKDQSKLVRQNTQWINKKKSLGIL